MYRYIVSVSNKFITFDVVTSDLARQVYPALEGLMVDLELRYTRLSYDNTL